MESHHTPAIQEMAQFELQTAFPTLSALGKHTSKPTKTNTLQTNTQDPDSNTEALNNKEPDALGNNFITAAPNPEFSLKDAANAISLFNTDGIFATETFFIQSNFSLQIQIL